MVVELCNEVHENLIYKVVMHYWMKNNFLAKSYVFVGVNKEVKEAVEKYKTNKVKRQFIKDMEAITKTKITPKQLGLDEDEVEYIYETLYNDDTIATIKSKIAHYILGKPIADEVYLWGTEDLQSSKSFVPSYVKLIFDGRPTIHKSEFLFALQCHFTNVNLVLRDDQKTIINETEALKAVSSVELQVITPIGVKIQHNKSIVLAPINVLNYDSSKLQISHNETTHIKEHGHLLESYNLIDRTMHCVCFHNYKTFVKYQDFDLELAREIYFPFLEILTTFDKARLTLEDSSAEKLKTFVAPKDSTTNCWPNFIHLRVNDVIGTNINIGKMFSQTFVDKTIPFIKYIFSTNTLYKMYKPYVSNFNKNSNIISKHDIFQWTKFDLARYMKQKQELLIMKFFLGEINMKPKFATIIVFEQGFYDVKLSFRVSEHVTMNHLNEFINNINDKLQHIFKQVEIKMHPIDSMVWNTSHVRNDTKIMRFMSSAVITSDTKTLTPPQLTKKLEALYHVFSKVSSENILHFLYKRVNDFTDQNNITQYMNRNSHLSKDELIQNIMITFNLEANEASEVYKDWAEKNKVDVLRVGTKVYYKLRDMHIVNVKIKPSPSGYYVITNGKMNVIEIQRIMHALRCGIFSNITELKPKKIIKKKDIQSIISSSVDDDDDDLNIDELLDDINLFTNLDEEDDEKLEEFQNKFFKNVQNNDDGESDHRIDKLKMECPKQQGGGKQDDSWESRYVLNKLKEADRELFDFEPVDGEKKAKRRTYSVTCQITSGRQPVVMTKQELDYNNKCFPGATSYYLNYGSTEHHTLHNYYSCPQVWCPKSRVGLTLTQFQNVYKNKCPFPHIEESPIIFNGDSQKYIGFIKGKHPNPNLHLPCCFKKPMKETKVDENVEKKADIYDKYIMNDDFPLQDKRLGLLPPILSVLFDNKFCAGQDGNEGLVNKQTDCFLRLGVPLSSQPFFEAMVNVLNNSMLSSVDDIVNSISRYLNVTLFLCLNDGLLCKKFMDDSNDIHDVQLFGTFKKWFLKQENYIIKHNLQHLLSTLKLIHEFKSTIPYADEVKREFLIYHAFIAFLNFIKDNSIQKTHELLFELFNMGLPWLNVHDFNIMVIEAFKESNKAFLSYPMFKSAKSMFKNHKPVVLLLKQSIYYEPIMFMKFIPPNASAKTKGSFLKTLVHDVKKSPRLLRIIHYYLHAFSNDTHDIHARSIFNALNSSANTRVAIQVLDYNMHVIGYYCKNGVYMPLKKTSSMVINDESTFMFVNKFYTNVKFDTTLNEANKLYNSVNMILDKEYYKVDRVIDNKVVLLIEHHQVTPLQGMIDDTLIEEYEDDLHLFLEQGKADKRSEFIETQNALERLRLVLRNELIELILRRDNLSLHHELEFLRHSHNPLPLNIKKFLLDKALQKSGQMQRILHLSGSQNISYKFIDKVCSKIGTINQCKGQCSWIVKDKKNGHCKLSLPQVYAKKLFIQCLEDLLNPMVPLKSVKVDTITDDPRSTLLFSEQDLLNAKFNKMLGLSEVTQAFDAKQHDISFNKTTFLNQSLKVEKLPFDFKEQSTILTSMRKYLKKHKVYNIVPYNNKWIFKFMTEVYNQTHENNIQEKQLDTLFKNRVSEDILHNFAIVRDLIMQNPSMQLHTQKKSLVDENLVHSILESKEYFFSEYELGVLAKLTHINIVVIGRKTQGNPDQIKCLGKLNSDLLVLLSVKLDRANHRHIYEPILDTSEKYVYSLIDFPDDFRKLVQMKCRSYTLSNSSEKASTVSSSEKKT